MQRRIPAVFMRGGTSKALVFHARDLPAERAAWDPIFLAAMGSPDPYGRQLNGMGGGVSSLSKVCVVGPPSRDGADVDYTFAQVQVKQARVEYKSNCGNMSAAIGPFAVDEGLVEARDGDATVRIHNTNTRKLIHSTFAVRDARAVEMGELEIPGVAGTGAPVRLDFLDPGGASTGTLLRSGNVIDILDVPGVGAIEVSMVDAANACVFVRAEDLGLSGIELPDRIESDAKLLERLAAIRHAASIAMGIAPDLATAKATAAIPYVGFVSAPQDAVTLSGETIPASAVDVTLRMLSNGQPHRALPLTASLCAAVAARIEGSIVNRAARARAEGEMLRLGMPSGVLGVDAAVRREGGAWIAKHGSFYRTTRRLFEGFVYPGGR
jgi:2-methylaconitate cis-trans-isomerase PrpF